MRIDTLHNFAVKLQDKTKNAVRRRMLRSEIDVEVADVMFCHGDGGSRFQIISEWWKTHHGPSIYCFAFSSPGST
jgi:hypothetical protein